MSKNEPLSAEFRKVRVARIMHNGIPSHYTIDELGTVRNTDTGKLLKWHPTHGGYWHVSLWLPGEKKPKWMKIHRLVAEYFLDNDNPESKVEVDHTVDKDTNSIFSLEWVTPQENCIRAVEKGLKKDVKINLEIAHNICKLIELRLYTASEIAEMIGCSKSIVTDIKQGNSWKQVSQQYNFPPIRKMKVDYRSHYGEIDKCIFAGMRTGEIMDMIPIEGAKRNQYATIIAMRRKILKAAKLV